MILIEKLMRYIECYIPTETCNFKCHYCYITQKRKFKNSVIDFSRTPEEIQLAFSAERLGGECLINLCAGGETLLQREILSVVKAFLMEGHYVSIVTNGSLTARFQEFAMFSSEMRERLMFKFSLHYLELKRLNLLEQFAENVNFIRKAGCSISVEVTPSDELIPYIGELKEYCHKNFGALCHVTIARDDRTNGIDHLSAMNFEDYVKTWSVFDSELFRFKSKIFYKKREEFCYAGLWSFYVNINTGVVTQCYCGKILGNIYDNTSESILFEPIGENCSFAHCYNGHAFLTLGNIPELETPTYAQVRDRVMSSGQHWLNDSWQSFIGQKLCENNFCNDKEGLLVRAK